MAGVTGGLLGVGGGFLMVPLQVFLLGTDQRRANATSLFAIIPISIAGALVYWFGGHGRAEINLQVALLLAAGGMLGAFLGARLAGRLSQRVLGLLVAAVLAIVGIKTLIKP